MQMHRNRQMWQYFRQHKVVSIVIGHIVVASALGTILLSSMFGTTLFGAFAQTPCSSTDRTYSVVSGDTLGAIAARFNTTWQKLASYNKLSNPNMLYVQQHICIPGQAKTGVPAPIAPVLKGSSNLFPYGQCTWWANQRYFQLHGVFVPWTTNSNAWQWSDRARDFHWRVSNTPTVGAIVDLQPWTQGAYSLGHVGVVEKILGPGRVLVSNMNWGANPGSVVNSQIVAGPGVSFITHA